MLRRSQLLWFGDAPPDGISNRCEDRDLRLVPLSDAENMPHIWPNAQGLIISAPRSSAGDLFRVISLEQLCQALWHGVHVLVLADLEDEPALRAQLKALPYGRLVSIWHKGLALTTPKAMSQRPNAASWSSSVAIQGDEDLCPEDRVLLRRAFSDCTLVKLVPLPGGRSAEVYCGFAQLQDSQVGPRPLPFFVKLDRYPKIQREISHYRECTTLFVPFNQRPNIDENRCALGAERGIIVGNFVENSESLAALVDRGVAQGAINSLFDEALRGWRSQAYHSVTSAVHRRLIDSLTASNLLTARPDQRRRLDENAERARSLGSTLSPTNLIELLQALPPMEHRCALMHGDLHGENVRVRGGDAILIDFASVQHGPLVGDPAMLDAALACASGMSDERAWGSLVDNLYAFENVRMLPLPRDAAEPGAHLWNSIRYIRRIGLSDQMSDGEYATAVAICLLRLALHKPPPKEDRGRRPRAYVLAERLLRRLKEN